MILPSLEIYCTPCASWLARTSLSLIVSSCFWLVLARASSSSFAKFTPTLTWPNLPSSSCPTSSRAPFPPPPAVHPHWLVPILVDASGDCFKVERVERASEYVRGAIDHLYVRVLCCVCVSVCDRVGLAMAMGIREMVVIVAAMLVFLVVRTEAVGVDHTSGASMESFFGWKSGRRLSSMTMAHEDSMNEFLDEPTRRILATRTYVSYGALSANRSPCPSAGRSYYNNCRSSGATTPYRRSCVQITRCARG